MAIEGYQIKEEGRNWHNPTMNYDYMLDAFKIYWDEGSAMGLARPERFTGDGVQNE